MAVTSPAGESASYYWQLGERAMTEAASSASRYVSVMGTVVFGFALTILWRHFSDTNYFGLESGQLPAGRAL